MSGVLPGRLPDGPGADRRVKTRYGLGAQPGATGPGKPGPEEQSLTTDRDPILDANLAALIRAAADDELTDAERARFEALLAERPELAGRVEFERRMRGAVGRVIASDTPAVSADLRSRIEAIASGARTEAEQTDDAVAGRLDARSGETKTHGFWARAMGGPITRGALSIAAMLAVAAILWTVAGPTPSPLLTENVARFVSSEHNRCPIEAKNLGEKFTVKSVAEVPEVFGQLTGRNLSLAALALGELDGMEFVDAGRCHVPPDDESSLHVRFRSADDTMVSLFIQPLTEAQAGKLGMVEGETYDLRGHAPKDGSSCATVLGWVADGVVHYMVSDQAEPCSKALKSLGQPMPASNL